MVSIPGKTYKIAFVARLKLSFQLISCAYSLKSHFSRKAQNLCLILNGFWLSQSVAPTTLQVIWSQYGCMATCLLMTDCHAPHVHVIDTCNLCCLPPKVSGETSRESHKLPLVFQKDSLMFGDILVHNQIRFSQLGNIDIVILVIPSLKAGWKSCLPRRAELTRISAIFLHPAIVTFHAWRRTELLWWGTEMV